MKTKNWKRAAALLLGTALCLLLEGCGGGARPTQSPSVPESSAEATQTPAPVAPADETPAPVVPTDETPAPDEKAAAREAYLDFLSGNGTVTTSEAFRWEDESYDWYTPAYGTYSYQELKDAITEEIMRDSTPHYTLLDLGKDGGAELLVLRFENNDPSFLNWTGVIRYDGGALTLTYSYEDGYRIEGELFTSGFLRIGGASGAGAYEEKGSLLEEDGTARRLYESFQLWGGFAPHIHYQLEEPQNGPMEDKYFDLSPSFCVRGYSDENGLKVYVEYSDDTAPEARALEEAFAQELTERGVQLVDEETFNRLFDQAQTDRTQPVTWTELEDGLPPQVG